MRGDGPSRPSPDEAGAIAQRASINSAVVWTYAFVSGSNCFATRSTPCILFAVYGRILHRRQPGLDLLDKFLPARVLAEVALAK